MEKQTRQSIIVKTFSAVGLMVLGAAVGVALTVPRGHLLAHFDGLPLEEQRQQFIAVRNMMHGSMMNHEDYRCCLEKPCTYCIEKDPKHGAGATCACLDDVANGLHPCGECIGEIMEGHGNPFMAKYFASALAEEMGDEYLEVLKQMMFDKYGVPVDEQK